jgi:UDP-glucuronate decarboxylase
MHPNDGRVVSNFIVQALKGEPITLYGTGSQSRSFCYVDDLVTGMIAMMDQDELVGPVNLGNPVEFTILELATLVKELTGSKSEIVFQPLPQDDPVRRRPASTLAKEKLRWEPTIPLRDGLIRTIDYFRYCHPALFVGRSFNIVYTREGTICQDPPGLRSSGCGNSRRS